jgi:Tol biopolymer transport system component
VRQGKEKLDPESGSPLAAFCRADRNGARRLGARRSPRVWLVDGLGSGGRRGRSLAEERQVDPRSLPQARTRAVTPEVTVRALLAAACICLLTGGCAGEEPEKQSSTRIPAANPETLGGTVAYSTLGGDIWVMNADGSGRRRLTHSGPGNDFDPDLSPDGRHVVFRTSRGRYAPDPNGIGLEGIFVIDTRTCRERQIQPRTGGLFPAWSPDGRKIAFSGVPRRDSTLDTIHLMNPDGSDVVDLGPPGECATWSPDGSKLAFCSHHGDGNWAIWVINRDGTDLRQLTHPTLIEPAGSHGDYPGAWSPDGDQIVYVSDADRDRELFVMNADGSNQHRLTHFDGGDGAIAWLPDGRIVFSHFRGDEPLPQWYVIRPNGTGLASLPQLGGAGDPLSWLPRNPRGSRR